jgi:non-ribosomal peptide synthetase component E (peptide arylation enzyme)
MGTSIPDEVLVVNALPTWPSSGKVDKQALVNKASAKTPVELYLSYFKEVF